MSDDRGLSQKVHNDLVMSFLAVRRAIGALGFFLPLSLIVWGCVSGQFLTSVSAAYYSPMREVFVGCLIAQAVFLWSYEGFRPDAGDLLTDKGVARIAAVAIALVALLPTRAAEKAAGAVTGTRCTLLECVSGPTASATIHLIAAGVFFAALAVYCLVLFVKGEVDSTEKAASNRIYRICGGIIILSIATIGVLFLTGWNDSLAALHPVFWLETLATFAFATSWMVKGDALQPLVRGIARMG